MLLCHCEKVLARTKGKNSLCHNTRWWWWLIFSPPIFPSFHSCFLSTRLKSTDLSCKKKTSSTVAWVRPWWQYRGIQVQIPSCLPSEEIIDFVAVVLHRSRVRAFHLLAQGSVFDVSKASFPKRRTPWRIPIWLQREQNLFLKHSGQQWQNSGPDPIKKISA